MPGFHFGVRFPSSTYSSSAEKIISKGEIIKFPGGDNKKAARLKRTDCFFISYPDG